MVTSKLPGSVARDPILGHIRRLKGDMVGLFLDSWYQYGKAARIDIMNEPTLLFTGIDALSQILNDDEHFDKGDRFKDFARVLGPTSIILIDGETWKRIREAMAPLLNMATLRSYVPGIIDEVNKICAQLPDEGVVDIVPVMKQLTLNVVFRLFFSTSLQPQEQQQVIRAIAAAFGYVPIASLLTIKAPPHGMSAVGWAKYAGGATVKLLLKAATSWSWLNFRYRKLMMDRLINRLISEHEAQPNSYNDLLSKLIGLKQTGKLKSDQEIRDQLVTMVFGGHGTTAETLSWSLFSLAKHEHYYDWLRDEIDGIVGKTAGFEMRDVDKCQRLETFLYEVTRMFPPVWNVPRGSIKDTVVEGYTVPAGTTVFTCPYIAHRDPDVFEHPEDFDPHRYYHDDGTRDRDLPPYAAFGKGKHNCIGRNMGLLVATISLIILLQRFEFEAAWNDKEPQPKSEATLTPEKVLLKVKKLK